MDEIKRGDVYWLNWFPARDSEQSGHRPGLVIQNDSGNRTSPTTIVASLTTKVNKSYPFMVFISTTESGLPKDSFVDLAHVMTVDKTRLAGKCGELSKEKILEVERAIKISLGLDL